MSAPTAEPALVGREGPLRAMAAARDDVLGGACRVVEVTGEPGIGKTRLLVELARSCAAAGMTVLAGRAAETDGEQPYAAVVEAVDSRVANLDIAGLGLDADAVAALGQMFPGLLRPSGEPSPAAVARAFRALLEQLSTRGGVALVLDDLHWADPWTVALVLHLLRHPPRGAVLIAVAHRPKQADAALAAALAAEHSGVLSLELGPLTEAEATALLGAQRSRARRAALYQAGGGNPFYLEVLASAPGAALPAADLLDGWPAHRTTAALHAELACLPERQRAVAHAAAVLGDPFQPELVAPVAGASEADVLAALDALADRDLVRQVGGSGRFAFRHAVVRHVAYRSAGAGWRLAAHGRAADALAAVGADAPTRAVHLQHCARAGDEEAIAVLTDAAATAVAPTTAARWLRTAARLLPATEEHRARRAGLLVALAEALAADDRLPAADEIIGQALRLLPDDDPTTRPRAVAVRLGVLRGLGRHAEAEAVAADELTRADGPRTAELRVERAAARLFAGGPADPHALDGVTDTDDRLFSARALAVRGLAAWFAGQPDQAATAARGAADLVAAMPDAAFATALDTVVWTAWTQLCLDGPAAPLPGLERAVALARRLGRVAALPRLLAATARAHTLRGDLDTAADCLDEAAELVDGPASGEARTIVLTVRCLALTHSGPADVALAAGERAVAAAERVTGRWATFAKIALADARMRAGDPQGCVDALAAAGGGPELPDIAAPMRAEVGELVVRAELAMERPAHAGAWADRAAAAAPLGSRGAVGFGMLAQAQVLIGRDPAAAVHRAVSACGALEAAGRRLDAARARIVLATALAAAGKRARAAAELSSVEQSLADGGATALLADAAREQRRLGHVLPHPREGGDAGLPALTRRETQVAELVTGGHTNRQIAHSLGVSDKTVEAHLARVFTKLGVTSRAAVAGVVARAKATDKPLTAAALEGA